MDIVAQEIVQEFQTGSWDKSDTDVAVVNILEVIVLVAADEAGQQ